MTWAGTVTLVVGASRGIGRTVAVAAAAKGAAVGLVARSEPELREALDEIGGSGGKAAMAVADVTDASQLRSAIGHLESELGPPDVVVASAGIGAYGAFASMDPAEMERLVRVNVLGTMHALHAVLPGMIARRQGHVVVIGSIAGRIGAPFEAAYSATKFAQVGMAEALSVELSAHGVEVSVVNPGPVETAFFEARGHPYDREQPRPIPAQQVADAVLAAVERRRFEQLLPRWLRAAVVFRHLAPPLYRWGARRSFRRELSAYRQRPTA